MDKWMITFAGKMISMCERFPEVIRSIWLWVMLVMLGLASPVTIPRTSAYTIAYDVSIRPSIAYDGSSLSGFDYDSASVLAGNEKQPPTSGDCNLFSQSAKFLAAKEGIQFGQASVKSTFAHGPYAGQTIGEVAQRLRAGTISPNSLPIDYVVRNGQAVTLNNRSLLALRRAGIEPTVTRNLTGNQAAEALLNSHLQGGAPSTVIRVRGGPPGTSLIE